MSSEQCYHGNCTVCEVLTEDSWQDEKRFKVTTGATLDGMRTLRFVRFQSGGFLDQEMPKTISIEKRPEEAAWEHLPPWPSSALDGLDNT